MSFNQHKKLILNHQKQRLAALVSKQKGGAAKSQGNVAGGTRNGPHAANSHQNTSNGFMMLSGRKKGEHGGTVSSPMSRDHTAVNLGDETTQVKTIESLDDDEFL